MKTKGWGPFRYDWYSFCSAHCYYNDNCRLCQCGSWHNNWRTLFGQWVFEKNPELWRWWTNGRKWQRPPIFKIK